MSGNSWSLAGATFVFYLLLGLYDDKVCILGWYLVYKIEIVRDLLS